MGRLKVGLDRELSHCITVPACALWVGWGEVGRIGKPPYKAGRQEGLGLGIVRAESRERLLAIVSRYDLEGVILGCIELPGILQPEHTAVRLLDTMRVHAEAALDYALGETAPEPGLEGREGSKPGLSDRRCGPRSRFPVR